MGLELLRLPPPTEMEGRTLLTGDPAETKAGRGAQGPEARDGREGHVERASLLHP